jgi:hypothetical protein
MSQSRTFVTMQITPQFVDHEHFVQARVFVARENFMPTLRIMHIAYFNLEMVQKRISVHATVVHHL